MSPEDGILARMLLISYLHTPIKTNPLPPITNSPPPSEDDLHKLYEEVRKGFASEGFRSLDDVRISVGTDDLGAFIDQYRDEPAQNEPPGYEPNRRGGIVTGPTAEKGL